MGGVVTVLSSGRCCYSVTGPVGRERGVGQIRRGPDSTGSCKKLFMERHTAHIYRVLLFQHRALHLVLATASVFVVTMWHRSLTDFSQFDSLSSTLSLHSRTGPSGLDLVWDLDWDCLPACARIPHKTFETFKLSRFSHHHLVRSHLPGDRLTAGERRNFAFPRSPGRSQVTPSSVHAPTLLPQPGQLSLPERSPLAAASRTARRAHASGATSSGDGEEEEDEEEEDETFFPFLPRLPLLE